MIDGMTVTKAYLRMMLILMLNTQIERWLETALETLEMKK